MRRMTIAIFVAGGAVLSLRAVQAPAKGGETGNKLEGRVLSVNRSAHTFRLRDAERGTATIRWTGATKFDGIRSSSLRAGKRVEVLYRVSNGRKVATKIEPGAGANHT